MSVSNELAVRTVERFGGEGLIILAGIVDLFIEAENGGRVPLGALGAGDYAPPVIGGPALIAVGRGEVETVPFTELLTLDASVIEQLQPSRWLTILAGISVDPAWASDLADPTGQSVAELSGQVLNTYLDMWNVSNQKRLTALTTANDNETTAAYGRSEYAVRAPNDPLPITVTSQILMAATKVADTQGFKAVEPGNISGLAGAKALAKVSHVRMRQVRLRQGWEHNPAGPRLGFIGTDAQIHAGQGIPVALIPKRGVYRVWRPDTKTWHSVHEVELNELACEFIVPFDETKPVKWRDLIKSAFMRSGRIWALVLVASFVGALLALVSPALTQLIMQTIVPEGNEGLLISIGVSLAVVALLAGVFSIMQQLAVSRVTQLGQLRVQSAVWDRTLRMPASFFRGYSSGDLMYRVMAATEASQIVSPSMIAQVLAAAFSVTSFVLMIYYSWQLSIVVAVILIATLIMLVYMVKAMRGMIKSAVSSNRIATSWIVQMLTGISKIRVAGAEDRLVAAHQDRIRGLVNYDARQTLVSARLDSFFIAVGALFPAMTFAVIYYFVWSPSGSEISPATYMAFTAAYGTVFGTVSALASIITPLATSGPVIKLADPILKGTPEPQQNKHDPGKINGEIEFRNVRFRYSDTTPVVLDGISFTIAAGEFVAIVGPSGAGKSSIVRLLLGFEQPTDGQILIDHRDLKDIDLHAMRARMGVVIQNAQLMHASILDNILAGWPLPEEAAWQAAEAVALADDIDAMPMGMRTLVDNSIVAGGQAQRILLARALVRKPSVVLLDEATSALDNESQAVVTSSLEKLGCTRVVVAHRLSTIKHADRILVVEGGTISETGTYQELLDKQGLFSKLVARQRT